jgi:dTDP-4-dehydrorhamnose reductase
MKVAVLGARGQLGSDLCPRLPAEVVPLGRADLDLDRPETVAPALAALRPDVVVNCAAYNLVDKAEAEPEAAFRTNAWGVRVLARACRDLGCRLVHFSTDYVFGLDAGRHTPLTEDDPPGPVSVYGLSKLAGEYLIRSTAPGSLVIRTCGLYGVRGVGGKGGNFVETMLRVAGQGKQLRVVADQRCTPSYTVDVAAAAAGLIGRGAEGVYHVTSSGDCTWHEFADEIVRRACVRADLTPITSREFGAAAQRPGYSVLSGGKLASTGVPVLRPWTEALSAYLRDRETRGNSGN